MAAAITGVPTSRSSSRGIPPRTARSHWFGGPDFAAEVLSRRDRSREKLGFYAAVGVRELLLVDRNPWKLELYRREGDRWTLVGTFDLEGEARPLRSEVLPAAFRLVAGRPATGSKSFASTRPERSVTDPDLDQPTE